MQRPEGKRIVLVRHARPVIDPARPAGEWTLADAQEHPVRTLASGFRNAGVDVILTSPEPKASGTAAILQHVLDVPLHEDPAFREQGNDEVPWLDDPAAFRRAVEHHFTHPDERVFGSESSVEAAERFTTGVATAFQRGIVPAIVSHGRVMCGYLRQSIGIDPMNIWPYLQMPDALLVKLDTCTVARITAKGLVPFAKEER